MNEQDLFAAFSDIDDDLLLSQPRKLPLRRSWLIAAVLPLLVITAYAAPQIIGAIQNAQLAYAGEQEHEYQHFDSREDTQYTLTFSQSEYTVELEITPADRIPETIETAYLPADLPDDWQSEEICINSPRKTLTCHWDIISDTGYKAVIYQQWPLDTVDTDETKTIYVHADPGAEVESKIHTIGEISVLEITATANPQAVQEEGMEHPVVFTTGGTREFYWSDGSYLFRLYVPYELDIGAVEDVISSLIAADPGTIPVEDSNKQF